MDSTIAASVQPAKSFPHSTTNREGYREYKSSPRDCAACPRLGMCTLSRDHSKIVTRHLWESCMEIREEPRHTIGNMKIYQGRKDTIERIFGTAKEMHGLRYTAMMGKARTKMKVGLACLCMNLKKLAKMKKEKGLLGSRRGGLLRFFVTL